MTTKPVGTEATPVARPSVNAQIDEAAPAESYQLVTDNVYAYA